MINNSGRLGKRSSDGLGVLTQADKFNQAVYPIPKIDSFAVTSGSYVPYDDTAADPAGGQTIVLYGSGFRAGATVMVGTTVIAVVTVLDNSRITFTSPALASGSYTIYVTNSNGGTGILVPGLVYSGMPVWSNAAGTLGSYYETTPVSTTVIATGDTPMTYSLTSGALPTGTTFFANGLITGTAPVDSASTTYTFTIQATDVQLQDTLRTFNLTINTDVVSWSNPSANTAYSLEQGTVMSNISLAATSAAGYAVSYAANALPSGVSLSNGVIYGTPTVVASNVSLLTATAATTTRSAVRVITWTINVAGDQYWKYTSLLLNANASITTSSFVNDNSLNNALITVTGDSRAQNANPYQPGYYSVQFNGTSDYLGFSASGTFAQNAFFGASKTFTVEAWLYQPSYISSGYYNMVLGDASGSSGTFMCWSCAMDSSNKPCVAWWDGTGKIATGATALALNKWNHVAWVSTAGVVTIYVNGVSQSLTGTTTLTNATQTTGIVIGVDRANYFTGYISNLRAVSGLALYTAAFTPSATPLLPIPSTSLLVCQSTRFIDSSLNNLTLTVTSGPKISPATPFTTVLQAGTQYYGGYFDGTGDYLTVANNAALQLVTATAFTIESWIYIRTLVAGDQGIISKRQSGSEWQVNIHPSFGYLNFWNAATTYQSNITLAAGQWYHIAVTWDATTLRFFVNGTMGSTYTGFTVSSSTNQVNIGCILSDGSNPFNGYISNLRVVKGQALYTANFVPGTSPLTTTSQGATAANVSLLTCQSSTFIDNSTNAFAITVAGDAKPLAQSPFTPVYYSNSFSGSGDYFVLAYNAALTMGANDFTIEMWYRPAAFANYAFLLMQDDGGSASQNFQIRVNSSGIPEYIFYSTSARASAVTITGSTALTLNAWNHIAVTYSASGTSTKLFLNGTQIGSSTTAPWSGSGYTGQTTVGNYCTGQGVQTSGNALVNGLVSNLRMVKGTALYTSTFTPPTSPLTAISGTSLLTCQSLYFVDNSTNVFAITATGSPKIAGVAPFTQPTGYSASAVTTYGSGYFDGSGDYLSIPANAAFNLTGDFTVECWVYFNSLTPGDDDGWAGPTIVSMVNGGNSSTLETYLSINLSRPSQNATPNGWNFSGGGGSIPSYGQVAINSTSIAPTAGTWYHIAFTRSGTAIKAFINGVLLGSATSAVTFGSSTITVKVGRLDYTYTRTLNGYVSDLRIVKGTALYTSAFVPNFTAPLTAVTNTQLLTLQSNGSHNNSVFSDNSGFNNIITRAGNVSNGTFSPYGQNWSMYGATGDGAVIAQTTATDLGAGSFTIEFWMYLTALGSAASAIITKRASDGALTGAWGVWQDSSYHIIFGGVGWGSSQTTTQSTTPNSWNHVAIVRSGTSLSIFINGSRTSVAAVTDSSNYTCSQYTLVKLWGNLNGTYPSGTALTDGYAGYLSNLRIVQGLAIYNVSSTTITVPTSPLLPIPGTSLLICQSNAYVDNSVNRLTVSRYGSSFIQKFSPFSTVTLPTYYSTYFDGSSRLVTSSTSVGISGTGNFTVECWFYLTAAQATMHLTDSATTNFLFLKMNAANICIGRSQVAEDTTITYSFAQNTWYHVAFTRSGSTVYGFVNGAQITSAANTNSYALGAFNIGQNSGGVIQGFNGYISNLRYTSTAIYTSAFTPSTTPLAAVTGTVILTGQSNTIIDNSTNYYAITVGNGTPKVLAFSPPFYSAYYSNYFDGTGDYLSTAVGLTSLDLTSGDFTLECWVYNSGAGAERYLFSQRGASSGWEFRINATNLCQFFYTGGSSLTSTGTITGSTWTHLAVTRSGTTVRIFINGALDSSATFSNGTSAAGSYGLYIGYGTTGGGYMLGYISNARIDKGQALYTAAFTPATSPLTTTSQGATAANVSLLTCQSPYFIDNSVNIYAITANGDTKVAATAPFAQPSNATDAVPYTPAQFSGSMYFDGTGDYLTLPTTFPLTTTGNFTIEAWVYTTSTAQQNIFYMLGNTSSYAGIRLDVFTSNNLILLHSQNGTTWAVNSSGVGSVPTNSWVHLAVTRNVNAGTLWVNGISTYTFTFGTLYAGTTNYIGAINNAGISMTYFGYITDVRVTNGVALYTANFWPGTAPATPTYTIGTTNYAAALLLNGTAGGVVDASRTVDFETAGDAKAVQFSPYSGSYYSVAFASATSDNFAIVPGAFGANNFTIEFWVNTSVTTGQVLFSNYNWYGGLTAASLGIYIDSTNTLYGIVITGGGSDANSAPYTNLSTSFAAYTGKWTHIALVRSGANVYLGVNGTIVASGTLSSNTALNLESRTTYNIGAWTNNGGGPAYALAGNISNFRIVKGTALYTGAYTVPTTPLTAISGTTFLSLQSNKFIDNSASPLTLTVNGSPKVQSQNPFAVNTGTAYYFDGTGDQLTSPNNALFDFGSGNFTIECWVYLSSSTGSVINYSNGQSANSNFAWEMYLVSATTIQFSILNGATQYISSSASFSLNVWHHVAGVRNGNTLTTYLNGVAGGTTATVTGVTVSSPASSTLKVSGYNNATSMFTGYVADLRITKGYARYTATFTPPTSPISNK